MIPSAEDDDVSVDIWSNNGEAENVKEVPQQQRHPPRPYDADKKHHKHGEGPSSSWGGEEVVKEEGLAFGVPYWDQVSVAKVL